jgi:uroporphyrin-III C-methyltransferase
VRLKGGDPLLFGRAQEEMTALARAGIACEVVPGVSAAFAAAAELGISLSERGASRSVVLATPQVAPGHGPSGWLESVLAADTAALYMAGGVAGEVAAQLIARGAPPGTPVVAVESATLAERREHATTLAQLGDLSLGGAGGPVILLLGRVFARRAAAAVA